MGVQFPHQLYGNAGGGGAADMDGYIVRQEHIFSLDGLMKEQGDIDCELKFIEVD